MLRCCNSDFIPTFKLKLPVYGKYTSRQIEYGPCIVCHCPKYKEVLTDIHGNTKHTQQLKGIRAVEAFEKAKFNRLFFISKKYGIFSNQDWYFGDFVKTNEKDEKGNPILLQIRQNLNGVKEVLGTAKVIYC